MSQDPKKLDLPVFNLTELIAGVEREVNMRYRVYPNLINRGKMTTEESKREIALMGAVLSNLKLQQIKAEERADLFSSVPARDVTMSSQPNCFHCQISALMLDREKAGQDVARLTGALLDVVADVILSQPPAEQDGIQGHIVTTLGRLVFEARERDKRTTH